MEGQCTTVVTLEDVKAHFLLWEKSPRFFPRAVFKTVLTAILHLHSHLQQSKADGRSAGLVFFYNS